MSKNSKNTKKSSNLHDIDDDDDDDIPPRQDKNNNDDNDDDWEDFEDEEGEGDWEEDLDDDSLDDDDDDEAETSRMGKKNKKKQQGPDLYAVLAVPKTATSAEIARAYRRKALSCHPDRNPEGAEEFKQLSAAYEVLFDEKQRKRYDRTGEVGHSASGGGDDDELDQAARSHEISEMLNAFMDAFRHSEEEIEDLTKAFVSAKGNLEKTLDHFMWTNEEGELERIVNLVNTKILANPQVEDRFKATWKKSATADRISTFVKKLDKERKEAEKMLQEILAGAAAARENQQHKKAKKEDTTTKKTITAGKKKDGVAGIGTLTVLPNLLSMRENAKKGFFSMADELEAKYCGNNKKAKK